MADTGAEREIKPYPRLILAPLIGVGMATFGSLFVVVLSILGTLFWLFGFDFLATWNNYFYHPAASILQYIFVKSNNDAPLTIMVFGIVASTILLCFQTPGSIIQRRFWASAASGSTQSEWRAMRDRLELLFGEDTDEFGLYLKRLIPKSSLKPLPKRSRGAVWSALISIGKTLLVFTSPLIGFCVFLAAFHSLHQEFASNGPIAREFASSYGLSDGSFKAMFLSDAGIIVVAIIATAIFSILVNLIPQTWGLPKFFFNHLACNLILTAIVLWLLMPAYFTLFLVTCWMFHCARQAVWMFALKPLYLRFA